MQVKYEKIPQAIYWYKLATTLDMDLKNGGFFEPDYKDYIPYINLCVCYYKIGDIKNAIKYNEMAGKIKPSSSSYLYNKDFFKNYN